MSKGSKEMEICCYMFGERKNTLEKGEVAGESTKIMASGRNDMVNENMPIIPGKAQSNTVEMDEKGVYRIINGKRIKVNSSLKQAKQKIEEKQIKTTTREAREEKTKE